MAGWWNVAEISNPRTTQNSVVKAFVALTASNIRHQEQRLFMGAAYADMDYRRPYGRRKMPKEKSYRETNERLARSS